MLRSEVPRDSPLLGTLASLLNYGRPSAERSERFESTRAHHRGSEDRYGTGLTTEQMCANPLRTRIDGGLGNPPIG